MELRTLQKLFPPDDPVRSWRWIMAFIVIFLALNGIAGRGLFAGVGAFAYASDVKKNQESLGEILELQIAATINDLKTEMCIRNGDGDVLRETIEAYQQRYKKITGTRYPVLACEKT